MAKTQLKTTKTERSAAAFLKALKPEGLRSDCELLARIMSRAAKSEGRMWGAGIVGFGDYRYKYESGRENDWFMVGFAPRKANIAVYLMGGLGPHSALLKNLGEHTTGKGCLYLKNLSGVDLKALETMVKNTVKELKKT